MDQDRPARLRPVPFVDDPPGLAVAQAVLVALLLLACSSSSLAGTFTAFGPRNAGFMVDETFRVRDPSGEYLLRIDNGGANGQFQQVSSAVVSLNGVEVWRGPLPASAQPVTLAARNRLRIQLTGPQGSGVTVQVIGIDDAPPSITASVFPEANAAGWHNRNPLVRFTCRDATSSIVSCPGPVRVSTEGAGQMVTGTAVDRAGNSASVQVTLNVDKTRPVLADFQPSSGATLPDPEISLAGGVREAGSGVRTTTCSTGSTQDEAEVGDEPLEDVFAFACNLPLVRGSNRIRVRATDIAGNVSRISFVTVRHAPVPHVTITSPAPLSISISSPITVAGTVDDPSATVTVNGIAASVANGSFTASVPLESGFHTITALGQTMAGSGSDSVQVLMISGLAPLLRVHSPRGHDIGDAPLDFVVGGEEEKPVRVDVKGWVRDNSVVPLGRTPEVTVRFKSGLNESTVTASVIQEESFECRSSTRCWNFEATQEYSPPVPSAGANQPNLTIEIEVHLDGRTSSRQLSGIVDFCKDVDAVCNDPSLCQPAGHRQNRRCVREADGCSNPIFIIDPARSDNPARGELGRISTAFGLDEEALPQDDPRRALTVFGQRRPIQLPCNRHDTCSSWTCPYSGDRTEYVTHRLQCDAAFHDDMKAVCRTAYPPGLCPDGIGSLCGQWHAEKARCHMWAWLYYKAVSDFSRLYAAFPIGIGLDPPQQTRCQGCPMVTED